MKIIESLDLTQKVNILRLWRGKSIYCGQKYKIKMMLLKTLCIFALFDFYNKSFRYVGECITLHLLFIFHQIVNSNNKFA